MDPAVLTGLTTVAAALGGFLLRHLLSNKLSQPSGPTPAPAPPQPAPAPKLPPIHLPTPNIAGHPLLTKVVAKAEQQIEAALEAWAERMLAGGITTAPLPTPTPPKTP